jgi:hypothetical protein
VSITLSKTFAVLGILKLLKILDSLCACTDLYAHSEHTGSGTDGHSDYTHYFLTRMLIFFGGIFCLFPYNIQHCFICRLSDSTVPTDDAGIEPRTVAHACLACTSVSPNFHFVYTQQVPDACTEHACQELMRTLSRCISSGNGACTEHMRQVLRRAQNAVSSKHAEHKHQEMMCTLSI